MNLPNKLTVSRFALTVLFLWALFCANSFHEHAGAGSFRPRGLHGFSRRPHRAQPRSHHQFRHFNGSAGGQSHDLLGVHCVCRKHAPETGRAGQGRGVDGHRHRRAGTGHHRFAAAGGVEKHRARRRKFGKHKTISQIVAINALLVRGRLSRMAGVAAEHLPVRGCRRSQKSCCGWRSR